VLLPQEVQVTAPTLLTAQVKQPLMARSQWVQEVRSEEGTLLLLQAMQVTAPAALVSHEEQSVILAGQSKHWSKLAEGTLLLVHSWQETVFPDWVQTEQSVMLTEQSSQAVLAVLVTKSILHDEHWVTPLTTAH